MARVRGDLVQSHLVELRRNKKNPLSGERGFFASKEASGLLLTTFVQDPVKDDVVYTSNTSCSVNYTLNNWVLEEEIH